MLVLALDTSSAAVTAGIMAVDGTVVAPIAEWTELNPRGHSELLAPNIAGCLADAGIKAAELDAIVAGTGPGPFTGLRVGLVTVAALADTLGIPAYGVCSLDAIGDSARDEPELLVVADARRKEVYWARYALGRRTDGPHVTKPADVPLDGVTALAGAANELYAGVWPDLPQRLDRYPSPHALVRCAAERLRGGAPGETLIPLYLRRPDATPMGESQRDERSREELAGRGAARAKRAAARGTHSERSERVLPEGRTRRISIVPMTRTHVDALLPFEREMFETEAWSRSSYLTELADTRHRHYVAAESEDGELLGWAGVRVLADEAEILTVGVVPAARRRGIGRQLLADLLEHARGRGARDVFLEVRADNPAALALYATEGFDRLGLRRGYYAAGRVDGVTMHRAL